MVNVDQASTSRAVHKEGLTHECYFFLQQEQPLYSISRELCIKVDTAGTRCWKAPDVCLLLKTGDGFDPEVWKPLWTLFPEASTAASELICCGCKRGCAGRCKCKQAVLKCTAMCLHGATCVEHDDLIRTPTLIFNFPVIVEVC